MDGWLFGETSKNLWDVVIWFIIQFKQPFINISFLNFASPVENSTAGMNLKLPSKKDGDLEISIDPKHPFLVYSFIHPGPIHGTNGIFTLHLYGL